MNNYSIRFNLIRGDVPSELRLIYFKLVLIVTQVTLRKTVTYRACSDVIENTTANMLTNKLFRYGDYRHEFGHIRKAKHHV